jgi:hypothetical protein
VHESLGFELTAVVTGIVTVIYPIMLTAGEAHALSGAFDHTERRDKFR